MLRALLYPPFAAGVQKRSEHSHAPSSVPAALGQQESSFLEKQDDAILYHPDSFLRFQVHAVSIQPGGLVDGLVDGLVEGLTLGGSINHHPRESHAKLWGLGCQCLMGVGTPSYSLHLWDC